MIYRFYMLIYLAYALLPAGSIVISFLSFWRSKVALPISVNKNLLFLFLYICSVWIVSFITLHERYVLNFISSSKIIFMTALAKYVSIINFPRSVLLQFLPKSSLLLTMINTVVGIGCLFYGPGIWGMRGDIGVVLATLSAICVATQLQKTSIRSVFVSLIQFCSLAFVLLSLEGRTAFFVFAVIYFTIQALFYVSVISHYSCHLHRDTAWWLGIHSNRRSEDDCIFILDRGLK